MNEDVVLARVHVCDRPQEGLVVLDYHGFGERFAGQVWTRVRLRRSRCCACTGRRLEVGEYAYRPVGNPMNRMRRIATSVIEGAPVGILANRTAEETLEVPPITV